MAFIFFRVLIVMLALLSPFFFPWSAVLMISVIAALFVPFSAIIVGCFMDTLYFGGAGFAYFTIAGAIIAMFAYIVQQFVKTRII